MKEAQLHLKGKLKLKPANQLLKELRKAPFLFEVCTV